MTPHPLRGLGRWVVLPGIAALAGGLANGIISNASLDAILLGAVVGAVPALAAALSARAWLAPILALSLGFCGLTVLSMWIFERPFLMAVSELAELNFIGMILAALVVLPAPIHAWRLGGTFVWTPVALHLGVGALLAAPLKYVGFPWEVWSSFGIVALGHVAAGEAALALCRRQK